VAVVVEDAVALLTRPPNPLVTRPRIHFLFPPLFYLTLLDIGLWGERRGDRPALSGRGNYYFKFLPHITLVLLHLPSWALCWERRYSQGLFYAVVNLPLPPNIRTLRRLPTASPKNQYLFVNVLSYSPRAERFPAPLSKRHSEHFTARLTKNKFGVLYYRLNVRGHISFPCGFITWRFLGYEP